MEVVPSVWIEGEVCKWPNYKRDAMLKAIKNCETPKETWKCYYIRVLYKASKC